MAVKNMAARKTAKRKTAKAAKTKGKEKGSNSSKFLKDKMFYILPLIIIAAVLIVDQVSKSWAFQKNFVVIKNVLEISFSQNPGIVFGWFAGDLIAVVIIPAIMVCFFAYAYFKEGKKHLFMRLGTPLIIAGLLGNLLDRFFRGAVTDFIFVPIVRDRNISNFNLADTSLIIGVVLVIVFLLWFEDGK